MVASTIARDKTEFIDLIIQALDEVRDLRAAIEYDDEFIGSAAKKVEPDCWLRSKVVITRLDRVAGSISSMH